MLYGAEKDIADAVLVKENKSAFSIISVICPYYTYYILLNLK